MNTLAMDPAFLPRINAGLNGLALILLVVGLVLVKRKQLAAHRSCMMAAFAVSAVFLVIYLADKVIKRGAHTPFNGEGWVKTAYYVMLFSHILLAVAVPVFAIMLIRHGLKGRIDQHRKLAKIAYPIWLYVSVTGVLIYFVLYEWNPPAV